MGNRTAELRELGCEGTTGWIVFQSTSMACFTPIFGNPLAANLFATMLRDIYPNWDDASQERLAGDINTAIADLFGSDAPEDNEKYDDYLTDETLAEALLDDIRKSRRQKAVRA